MIYKYKKVNVNTYEHETISYTTGKLSKMLIIFSSNGTEDAKII